MYYVPQPIPSYLRMEMQGFRKGNCTPYQNIILVNGSTMKMPNVMFKRLTSGAAATVTLVDLYDSDVYTVTTPSQSNFTLDDPVDAYEMRLIPAGNWTLPASPMGGFYYLRIESGVETHYTEAFYLEQTTETFPQCSEGWVKITWTDGRCIQTGASTDGVTPVMAYPDASHSFFLFLRADLSQPEWETEEQGATDGAGVFVATSQRVAKRWKLEGHPVSEAVIDALQSSTLFETVTIEFQTGEAFAGISEIKITPEWEQGGCFAKFEYTFTESYLLKQGCC